MLITKNNLVIFLLLGFSLFASASDTVLWYEQPAKRWEEALPLGNGRMGAMVFGRIQNERFQLNEESLWAGKPFESDPDNFQENLKNEQDLVLEGKITEAGQIGREKLVKSPTSFRSYEPLADLLLTFKPGEKATNYRRDLATQGTCPGTGYAAWAGGNPLLADPNGGGDGCSNALEYGAGSDVLDPSSRPAAALRFEDLAGLGLGANEPVYSFTVAGASDDVALLPSTSTDLRHWSFEPLRFLDATDLGGNRFSLRFHLTTPPEASRFFRLGDAANP